MKVRTIKEIENTDRDVDFAEGKSLRLILEKDSMGFSVHKTIIPTGNKGHWHYKNHLEACYCIMGYGVLTNLTTGEEFDITPDSIYLLDEHDNHTFEAVEDIVLISIFNPPVTGKEVHGNDGSYSIPNNKDTQNKIVAQMIVEKVDCCTNNYDCAEEIESILNLKY